MIDFNSINPFSIPKYDIRRESQWKEIREKRKKINTIKHPEKIVRYPKKIVKNQIKKRPKTPYCLKNAKSLTGSLTLGRELLIFIYQNTDYEDRQELINFFKHRFVGRRLSKDLSSMPSN